MIVVYVFYGRDSGKDVIGQPTCLFHLQLNLCMLNGYRSPSMFTQQKQQVDPGKLCFQTDKPLGSSKTSTPIVIHYLNVPEKATEEGWW